MLVAPVCRRGSGGRGSAHRLRTVKDIERASRCCRGRDAGSRVWPAACSRVLQRLSSDPETLEGWRWTMSEGSAAAGSSGCEKESRVYVTSASDFVQERAGCWPSPPIDHHRRPAQSAALSRTQHICSIRLTRLAGTCVPHCLPLVSNLRRRCQRLQSSRAPGLQGSSSTSLTCDIPPQPLAILGCDPAACCPAASPCKRFGF